MCWVKVQNRRKRGSVDIGMQWAYMLVCEECDAGIKYRIAKDYLCCTYVQVLNVSIHREYIRILCPWPLVSVSSLRSNLSSTDVQPIASSV